ncbi:MAG TPA: SGNH/GDSL hydrolase family protein [Dermatophilaceae bacterium]|nr:SGNH/GDSL hydrolase family protein [Dermatophilaceae bacterium]
MGSTSGVTKRAARVVVAFVAALLTATLVVLVAPAASASDRVERRPDRYLLALGDSISFGFQGPKVTTPPDPSVFDTGYVDVLRARYPSLQVTNFSCPGETTTTMIAGGCPWSGAGWGLHDEYTGSQLDAAVSFLRSHRRSHGAVTVAIWGNDILALRVACDADIACIAERAPAEIAAFSHRLDTILRALRAAAPSARIAVLAATHAIPPPTPEIDALYDALNTAIAATAAASRVRVADPRAVFNPPDATARLAAICAYTLICATGGADGHPSDAGYRVIADTFAAVLRPMRHAA